MARPAQAIKVPQQDNKKMKLQDIQKVQQKLKEVRRGKLAEFAADELRGKETWLADLNREQMLRGENAHGGKITPSYLNDPFFKTPEQARKYAQWKQEITPNPRRDFATPNLIIRGDFHESITAKISSRIVRFETATLLGRKVTAKFTNVLGMNPESRYYIRKQILPQVKRRFLQWFGS